MSTGERTAVPPQQGETAKETHFCLCLEGCFSSTNPVKMPCFMCTSYRGFYHSSLIHWQWTRFNASVKHCSTTTNLHHGSFISSLSSVHYTLSLQDIWQMKCVVHCFSTDRMEVLCKGTYFYVVFFPPWAQLWQGFSLSICVPNPYRNVSKQQLTCSFCCCHWKACLC